MDGGGNMERPSRIPDSRRHRIRVVALAVIPWVCACTFSAWIWIDHGHRYFVSRGPESVAFDIGLKGTTMHPIAPRAEGALELDFRDTVNALRTRQSASGLDCASLVTITWRTDSAECERICDASVRSESLSPRSGCLFLLESREPGMVEVRIRSGGEGCGSWMVPAKLAPGSLVKHAMEEVTHLWPATILALGIALASSWWVIRKWRRQQTATAKPRSGVAGPT